MRWIRVGVAAIPRDGEAVRSRPAQDAALAPGPSGEYDEELALALRRTPRRLEEQVHERRPVLICLVTEPLDALGDPVAFDGREVLPHHAVPEHGGGVVLEGDLVDEVRSPEPSYGGRVVLGQGQRAAEAFEPVCLVGPYIGGEGEPACRGGDVDRIDVATGALLETKLRPRGQRRFCRPDGLEPDR